MQDRTEKSIYENKKQNLFLSHHIQGSCLQKSVVGQNPGYWHPKRERRKKSKVKAIWGALTPLMLKVETLGFFRFSPIASIEGKSVLKQGDLENLQPIKHAIPPGLVVRIGREKHCLERENCQSPLNLSGNVSRLGRHLKLLLASIRSVWGHKMQQRLVC